MLKKLEVVEVEAVVGGAKPENSRDVADTVKEVFHDLTGLAKDVGGEVKIEVHCEPKTDIRKDSELNGERQKDGLTQHKETIVTTKEGPYVCKVDGSVVLHAGRK